MSCCVIFGGCGSLGSMLARHLAEQERFSDIVLADIRQAPPALPAAVRFVPCDVRHEFTPALASLATDWIFNFAAVRPHHGETPREHFDTHLAGTRQITAYAERVGCDRVFFASTGAVYGRTERPTDESAPTYPETPKAVAKLVAEAMLATWQARSGGRRLVVVRPGPIYGPGCAGELRQAIRAVRRGGVFPGGRKVRKSYGYLAGLLESIDFTMAREEAVLTYNYAEPHSATLAESVRLIRHFLGSKRPAVAVPPWLARSAAAVLQGVLRDRSPLDLRTIREATTGSSIVPRVLQNLGFQFRYGFLHSLEHWRAAAPKDFA